MTGDTEPEDLVDEIARDATAFAPSEVADPQAIVDSKIPLDIREKYEVYSYRNAAVVLRESHTDQLDEILGALREFKITTRMIRIAGGNESDIPKLFSEYLRQRAWHETVVQGDLLVKLHWKEPVRIRRNGTIVFEKRMRETVRGKFLDGHKIDYVKGKVAFDLEWNSKDQTFDRDLYAFSAFAQCGVIDAAVLVTRSQSLDPVFHRLGPSLKKDGTEELKGSGKPRLTSEKYGASTTWMGKLLYRLNAGRNGGCPVLAVGITPRCIEDWNDADAA